ncbi:ATP-binding cassette domain-containing protein [Parapusillimonas granuli]|uniref:ATP-binding cassette domain-containing protein n=2 Tax=Parapusillimonas granuli TaxID=380911 RepID=A0A853FUR8_9BURK|nr:ATP-binding cassette domain-containing protein [Parapusillimonas granuli]
MALVKKYARGIRAPGFGSSGQREIASTIWDVVWRFRRRTAAALALLVAAKVFALLVPVALKNIIDGLGAAPGALSLPVFLLLAYALLRFLSGLFTELRDMAFARVAATAVADFTVRVFDHLHHLGARFHGGQQTGAFARDVSRGTAGIGFLLGTALFTVLPTVIEIVSIVIILLSAYAMGFAGVLALTFIAYTVYTIVFTERRIRHQRALNELDSAASGHLVDSLTNYETVKLYTSEQAESQRLAGIMNRWIDVGLDNQKALSILHVGQSAIIAGGVATVMLMAGQDVVNGTLTVGDLVLINAYVIQVCLPLNTLGLVFRQTREALINAERMSNLLRLPTETEATDDLPPLRVEGGAVSFDKVDFAYEPARRILHDVSFRIEPAQQVAVVGGSGSGKSTLARLLLRLYDADRGTISIDGQDVRAVTQASLRAAIGVVPQESLLFNNTIFYNIAYGRPGASVAQVIDAAKAARIHDLIESLPAQYDTSVGERGVKLSGGERQRIAIARAFLKNPPILVLDEATSALDTRTERAIQQELKQLSRGRSTLIIAHRLSTIVDADQILVMDHGRIVERGTHQELLRMRGQYAQMWQLQLQQEALDQTGARLSAQPINLVALVAGVIDSLRAAIDARGIVLYTSIRADAARVTGDPAALQRLLAEMLENAIAFTPPDGRIAIGLERQGGDVAVAITDGRLTHRAEEAAAPPGEAEAPLPVVMGEAEVELLDPLRASALMEQMGGRFETQPTADGSGLAFILRMPLRAVVDQAPRPLPQPAIPEPLKGLNIYVVDDLQEARMLLGESLEDHGARTVRFASGETAIEALNEQTQDRWPDVLICDISLGEIDGYQVMGRIRQLEEKRSVPLSRRLPAIALSGHSANEDRLYALLAGFQVYMTKPVDPRELVATVLALTRGRGRPPPA